MSDPWPTQAFIAGDFVATNENYQLRSPATGEILTEVANSGPAEAHLAVAAAEQVFPAWRAVPPAERGELLGRWHQAVLDHGQDIARTMTLEMGKPIKESWAELRYGAGFISFYAEEARRGYGNFYPGPAPDKRILVRMVPVGPVYAVTPWNFPLAMVTRKLAPALAAGCPVILKPASQTPLTALILAQLWRQVGGLAGTLQVLPSRNARAVSQVCLDDPRIRKLTFTGSTEVGIELYQQAARTVKRVSLELGGHAPFLVFADADIEVAVNEAVKAKFRNVGQSCVAANRIYVAEPILAEFTEAFAEAVGRLKIGDPLDPETDIGPLVDQNALTKVAAQVDDARSHGAELVMGGASRGLTYLPTVLSGVKPGALILQEETFGPVAPIVPFRDESEAISLANDTPYGLASYLWTCDLGRAFRVSEALNYGIVGVNDGAPSNPEAPFGGMKLSGIGREGGPWGLEAYLEPQYISLKLP